MRKFDLADYSDDLIFYPKYKLGKLCWFKSPKTISYCGHYAGFYCDDFETMHIKLMVNCDGIYSVDNVFETKDECDKS